MEGFTVVVVFFLFLKKTNTTAQHTITIIDSAASNIGRCCRIVSLILLNNTIILNFVFELKNNFFRFNQ